MAEQTAPPVLSTPETHLFEDPTPAPSAQNAPQLTDDEVWEVYEIQRTAKEVWEGGFKRVALQFPDTMLKDATRIFEGLERQLKQLGPRPKRQTAAEGLETSFTDLQIGKKTLESGAEAAGAVAGELGTKEEESGERTRLYILADTSYGSCCVDEIAAEHVEADVVVHYGRSCLSPTARLPVIYVFTSHPLALDPLIDTFESTFLTSEGDGRGQKVVLMADITYNNHLELISQRLSERGWKNLVVPEVVHDPSSIIPNRRLSEEASADLKSYKLFHISDPPSALLLTLSSQVDELFIYPTSSPQSGISNTGSGNDSAATKPSPTKALLTNTSATLSRRYALVTRLSTNPIFGILINTLSVRNYLETVSTIASLIARAGKKSYTFVVGKVNAAKIANFSEIGGWVVVGCWESSLIESQEFFRPIITPFELSLCLQGDEQRVWTGEWRGDFGSIENSIKTRVDEEIADVEGTTESAENDEHTELGQDEDSEEESLPPEFDLRTGRYVSHSRPMRTTNSSKSPITNLSKSTNEEDSPSNPTPASKSLTKRAKGDLATINGAVSPGAEYLRNQRTWTGLGSDFHEDAETGIEEGRSGVARGYTVGEDAEKR